MKIAIALLLACSLGGCVTVPLATGIALAGAGLSAGALGSTLYHNCRGDGGCKGIPLPK